MIRVVVVDDQELVRTGFGLILNVEDDISVVATCADGVEAVEVVQAIRPDVVLMDIRMPRMDGVAATKHITASTDASVIILTTFDLDEYVFSALEGGASGFLLKDTPAEDLVDAIRVVAAGEALLAPSVTRRLIERFQDTTHHSTAPVPELNELTDRETEVLVQMARGLSNTEIGVELFVGESTVKTHVGRILTKLAVRDRVQAVVVAYNSGLVRPGDSA